MISRELMSYFNAYKETNELANQKDGAVFCRFATETIIERYAPQEVGVLRGAIESICVDGYDDTGIDAICILINGEIITSTEYAFEKIENSKKINVEFYFFQHEFFEEFKMQKFTVFIDGVKDFLSSSPKYKTNQAVADMLAIKDYLFSEDVLSKVEWLSDPCVRLFYASVGRWKEPQQIVQVAEKFKDDIQNLPGTRYNDDVTVEFADEARLITFYKEIRNQYKGKLSIRELLSIMPEANDDENDNLFQNAIIVSCTGESLVNLLKNDDGKLRESLFEDNVRAYQGDTPTNSSIYETAMSNPEFFGLYNNGITIVCDKAEGPIRNTYILTNPQVVNGCQTSTCLFRAHESGCDMSKILVFAKIIATDNPEFVSQVVCGTNTQNIVPRETFAVTKPFHKELEEYIIASNSSFKELDNKVFYERRSKQYLTETGIKNTQKISFSCLTRYFVAMFFSDPHNAHKHENVLLRGEHYGNRIYQDNQSKFPYYITALCYAKMGKYFKCSVNNSEDYKIWRTYTGHLLFLLKELAAKKQHQPNINNKAEVEKYCDTVLCNITEKQSFQLFANEALKIFKAAFNSWPNKYSVKDTESFSKHLCQLLYENDRGPVQSQTDLCVGDVLSVKQDKVGGWFLFISRTPDNIWAHQSHNLHIDFSRELMRGVRVSYKVESYIYHSNYGDETRLKAVDIQKV